jgi:hypothetical protein
MVFVKLVLVTLHLGVVYSIYWAWSYMNPVILAWSWRKLLSVLEGGDLQGVSNEEMNKSELLDMV